MLSYLADFSAQFSALNLFRYITLRSGGAAITAALIGIALGPWWIRTMSQFFNGVSSVREDLPDTHNHKHRIPSMGGVIILISLTVSVLLWGQLDNALLMIVLGATLAFGAIGFADDMLKKSRRKGMSGLMKLALQVLCALGCAVLITRQHLPELQNMLALPWVKTLVIPLGALFPAFAVLVLIGSANAVNLTDGLDGLAAGAALAAVAAFALIAYVVGHQAYALYLHLHPIPGGGELAVFCSALIGSLVGFLWYNCSPAQIFMGDTGALSLGAALGALALATKHEISLAIIGGLFVIETLSVILQVGSFKLRGQRVFLMAPLHHHFEKKGWAEPQIVVRFWIIAVIFALIGLSTLKLR